MNGNKKPGATMNMHSEPARPKATRTNSSLLPRPQLLDLELDLQAQVLPEPLILKSEKRSELVCYPVKSQVVGVDQGGFGMDETIIGGVTTSDEMDHKNRVVKKVIKDDTYGEYFDS